MRIIISLALLLVSALSQAEEPDVQTQLQNYYFDAARRGDVAMLDTFIESGYTLDIQDSKGYTALILAAASVSHRLGRTPLSSSTML